MLNDTSVSGLALTKEAAWREIGPAENALPP